MSMSLLIQEFSQFRSIDKVPVVRHADSVGAVDIKWLGFRVCAAASCRISQMTQTHESRKVRNAGSVVEDFGCHSIALALVEPPAAATTDDARGILSTVLE